MQKSVSTFANFYIGNFVNFYIGINILTYETAFNIFSIP